MVKSTKDGYFLTGEDAVSFILNYFHPKIVDLSCLNKKDNDKSKNKEKKDNMDKVKIVAENFFKLDCSIQNDLISKILKEAYVAGFNRGVERQKAVEPKEDIQPWYKRTKDGWEKNPPSHEDLIVTIYDDNCDNPYYYTAPAWCVDDIWIADNEVLIGTVVAWRKYPEPCEMDKK